MRSLKREYDGEVEQVERVVTLERGELKGVANSGSLDRREFEQQTLNASKQRRLHQLETARSLVGRRAGGILVAPVSELSVSKKKAILAVFFPSSQDAESEEAEEALRRDRLTFSQNELSRLLWLLCTSKEENSSEKASDAKEKEALSAERRKLVQVSLRKRRAKHTARLQQRSEEAEEGRRKDLLSLHQELLQRELDFDALQQTAAK